MKKPPALYLSDMPGGPCPGTLIAKPEDLTGHGGKDIIFRDGSLRVNIFVQQHEGTIRVYENRCPHAGTPLNMFGDRFLDLQGRHLLCRTHGARFDPASGKCVRGPCKGQFLREVAIEERADGLYSL